MTTRIVAMVDKAGRLAGLTLPPGNAHEPHSLPALLAGAPANALTADRTYANAAVLPSRARRKKPRWYAPGVYGMRHFVENRFAAIALKGFRGIARRYCQRALRYGGMLNLVSVLVAFRAAVFGQPAGGRPAVNRRLAL